MGLRGLGQPHRSLVHAVEPGEGHEFVRVLEADLLGCFGGRQKDSIDEEALDPEILSDLLGREEEQFVKDIGIE